MVVRRFALTIYHQTWERPQHQSDRGHSRPLAQHKTVGCKHKFYFMGKALCGMFTPFANLGACFYRVTPDQQKIELNVTHTPSHVFWVPAEALAQEL